MIQQSMTVVNSVMNKSKILFLHICIFLFINPLISYANKRECVILLHGLAKSNHSMVALESSLKSHNYIVVNESYPSTTKSIESLAAQYIPPMVNMCLVKNPAHINFVTHSLGGIILQQYMQKHKIPKLSRIVMLGPPNHGSELADLLHTNLLFQLFTGPAGQELTTQHRNLPNKLHLNHHYQIGVIAGNFSLTPFGNFIFHEPNDGKVTVSSARTNTMKDFIVLPVSHTFMMRNVLVQKQTLNFLEYGKFKH